MALIARTVMLLFALAFSAGAWTADKDAAAGATQDLTRDRASWLDMRTSELLGKEVASPQGKALGKVEDLIIDLKGGGIPHVVLSFGGIANLGDKLFVFPVNAFERDENRDRIVIDVERHQLRESRGFERGKWPFDAPLQRASELRGRNVKDSAGNPAGEIEDLVVNLGTGRVKEVVLAQDGRKGPEPKQVLPLSAFLLPADRGGNLVLKAR
jgi:sporulation protein YlmC with PRC-barrel domain